MFDYRGYLIERRKDVELSYQEYLGVLREGQNPKEIFRLKGEWTKAIEKSKKILKSTLCKVEYSPECWYSGYFATTDGLTLYFPTPNKEVNFDVFPSFESKVGTASHEAGHFLERKEILHLQVLNELSYLMAYILARFLVKSLPCEQRANLLTAYAFPNELWEASQQIVKSRLKMQQERPEKLGEYELPLAATHMLGDIGMPRRDDLINLFKEIQENKGLRMDKYLEEFFPLPLAGLAIPLDLQCLEVELLQKGEKIENKYGINSQKTLQDTGRILARYLRKEITYDETCSMLKNLGYKTSVDEEIKGYRPEYSVSLAGIKNPTLALENLNGALSFWEHAQRRHSSYHAAEDVVNALSSLEKRLRLERANQL